MKGIAPATTILLMNAELYKRIGSNIRRIRLQRCLFVELVAERLGKPAEYVIATEQGMRELRIDDISSFAKALECSLREIMG